jgi:ATP/maltotriose-dependent transcriptional regulator MalT/DNA-binding MarR family transcriptional regulator
MPKKQLLTVSEKILLHLKEHGKYEEMFEVPYSLTQNGIAEVVKARRSYVSQATKELAEKGLVEDRLCHVKGEGRRRKTYFLTPSGKMEATKVRDHVENLKVMIEDGESKEPITIHEVMRQKMKGASILDVLDCVTEDGVFDPQRRTSLKPTPALDSIQVFPKPKQFYGREEELERINEFLKDKGTRILAIRGIAGMGKTTLIAKIVEKNTADHRIFWYRFHDWSTQRNVLSHLSEFLKREKRDALKLYLDESRTIDLGDVQGILKTQMFDISAMLVFDDFHRANENIVQLFEAIYDIMDDLKDIKIVLLGRKIPRFYDRRDVLVRKYIKELELEGLDRKSSLELLMNRNIQKEYMEDIYETTKGHPLSLELIEVVKGEIGKGEMKHFLWEEVLARLNEGEKNLLRFASVFRYPVSSEAYLLDPINTDITHETIDELVGKSLLTHPDSKYDVHDMIREFFYQRLSPESKSAYHKKVAEYFEDEADDLALVEAQYHYIKAGNDKRAVELAIQYGEHLIGRGFLEEFLEILNSISKDDLPDGDLSNLLIMEGDILTTFGEWDDALSLYQRSLKAAEQEKDPIGCAEAHYKIAAIYYRKGDLKKALYVNQRSFDILMDQNEPFKMAKLYNNFGVIYWKLGSFEKARKNYAKSLEIAEDLGDMDGVSRALNNLGIIHWEKGDLDGAIEFYQRSLEIAKEQGNIQTEAILYDNLGEVFRSKEDIQKALEYYEKSLKLSQMLGFRWQIAEVLRNIGTLYHGEDGRKYLIEALNMFEKLGAKKDVLELKERLEGQQ